jgi:hypothetical protein
MDFHSQGLCLPAQFAPMGKEKIGIVDHEQDAAALQDIDRRRGPDHRCAPIQDWNISTFQSW